MSDLRNRLVAIASAYRGEQRPKFVRSLLPPFEHEHEHEQEQEQEQEQE